MGSSKKHKEKRDRKKHKKGRSRSRERDSHKRSHKSIYRKEKRKSPDRVSPVLDSIIEDKRHTADDNVTQHNVAQYSRHETEKSPVRFSEPSIDDEFDIDKLLDSKLSEKNENFVRRAAKRRSREEAIEEFKRRQNIGNSETSSERFSSGQSIEYGHKSRPSSSPPVNIQRRNEPVEIPFINDVSIKEEPPDEPMEGKQYLYLWLI